MIESVLLPLGGFQVLPRNPKDHDIGVLHVSLDRWGFLERVIVNKGTGHILGGHGRIETLQQKRATGQQPPAGVQVSDGDWLIPADYVDVPADQEEAVAVALNRTVEAGGWHNELLADVLSEIAKQPQGLSGTGYDLDDLDMILADAGLLDRLTPPPDEDDLPEGATVATYGVTVTVKDAAQEDLLYARLVAEGLTVKKRSA